MNDDFEFLESPIVTRVSNSSLLNSKIGFKSQIKTYVELMGSDGEVKTYLIGIKNGIVDPITWEMKDNFYPGLLQLSANQKVIAIFDYEQTVTLVFKSDKTLKYCFTSKYNFDESVSICVIKIICFFQIH